MNIRSGQQTPVSMLHVEPQSQAEETVAMIEGLFGSVSFRFLSGNDLTKDDTDDQIKSAIRKTI